MTCTEGSTFFHCSNRPACGGHQCRIVDGVKRDEVQREPAVLHPADRRGSPARGGCASTGSAIAALGSSFRPRGAARQSLRPLGYAKPVSHGGHHGSYRIERPAPRRPRRPAFKSSSNSADPITLTMASTAASESGVPRICAHQHPVGLRRRRRQQQPPAQRLLVAASLAELG